MTGRPWEPFLTEQDKQHVAAKGLRPRFEFGQSPALLSIDNYRWAVGDKPEPLLESIKRWPGSTGLAGWEALGHIETLLASARASQVPIVHVTGLSTEESGVALWAQRGGMHASADPDAPIGPRERYELMPQAAPQPGEAVLRKAAPSAFFSTPLVAHLTALGVDTLIVCGESTSGCVRASVVDGRSYRYRMIVVEECVYDRHESAHAMSLFDMSEKYADVLPLAEVTSWIEQYRVEAIATQSA